MNADFPRLITLLRKEKGISQKKAAGELGISQALLSHYEKGIRECGLEFVVRCSRFYEVSTDYLLGVSPDRHGNTLTAENITDPDSVKDNVFHGNVMPVLNKKLIANSMSVVFDLVGQSECEQLNDEISRYLMAAVYRSFRILYAANPKNEQTMFSIPEELASAYVSAAMDLAEARAMLLVKGINRNKEDLVRNINETKVTNEFLSENWPQQSSSLMNMIMNIEGELNFPMPEIDY